MRISPTKSTFFLGKNFGDTRHPYEKNEPTLDHSGGGVHGKVCWLIAYYVRSTDTVRHKFSRVEEVCFCNFLEAVCIYCTFNLIWQTIPFHRYTSLY